MKKGQKIALMSSPAFLLLIIGVAWVSWLKPYILKTIKQQLPEINQAQEFVEIEVDRFDLSLLKLQLTANQGLVRFKQQTLPFNELTVDQIKLQLDPFNLLIGQISASYLQVTHLNWTLKETQIPKSESKSDEINLESLFELLPKIPIQKVVLSDSNFNFETKDPKLKIHSFLANLIVTNKKTELDIIATNLRHRVINEQKISTEVQLSFRASLEQNNLNIRQARVQNGSSYVALSLQTENLKSLLIHPQIESTFQSTIRLEDVKTLSYFFHDQKSRLPQVFGTLDIKGQAETNGRTKNSGEITIATQDVQVDNLKFGNAQLTAQLHDNDMKIDEIDIMHPSGKARLTQVQIEQQKPYSFKAKADVSSFNLQKLFTSLDLKNIPADLDAAGTGTCTGTIMPFAADCFTEMQVSNVDVKPDVKDTFHIVELKKGSVTGNVNLSAEAVKYTAEINIGKSLINSTGLVDFSKGFDMQFKSKSLVIDDIDNVAGLGLKGIASGELSTSGNSSYGLINSKLKIDGLIIDRFQLGQIETSLGYKAGELTFLNSTGQIGSSKYKGQVGLNFHQTEITGAFEMAPLYGADVITALKNRFGLGFAASGQGQAKVDFTGPLDFWKLKMNIDARLNRGTLMDESFTRLDLRLRSNGNLILFDEVRLVKPSGMVQFSNKILTEKEPEFDIDVLSHNLKTEEIDHMLGFFPNSSGNLTINGKLKGPILKPDLRAQVSLKDFAIDSQVLPASQGDLQINANYLQFDGQIFGRQTQSMIKVPFNESQNFVIKTQLRDFNPLLLLPLIKLPVPASDTYSSLTADVDISTPSNNLDNLNGKIVVQNFLLQRSSQYLKLSEPGEIIFNNGLSSLTPFVFRGPDQNLNITLKRDDDRKYLNFAARLSLRPFQFLIPFSDNLSGLIEFNCSMSLNSSRLNLAGEGLVDSGTLSMKGFPYPITDISAYFDFSQSKIIISEISAMLNQAPLEGQGQIDFKDTRNIDVNLTASANRIDMEFPAQIQTNGNLKVALVGNWMPYTLKVDYTIDQGMVTKEFTDEAEDSSVVLRPSNYLPQQQLTQKIQSIILDINTNFLKGMVIKNRILEGILTGTMKITGSPENPILSGRIDIQNGSRLIFKDKPFDIQTGNILFHGTPEINPEIYITANARVSDYDINLLIQGPSKNLAIKPTSQPPLGENDLFSLLALGYTSSKMDQTLTSGVQQQQTGLEVLATLTNQSRFNKKLQQKLGLNVQLAPSIDSTRNIAVPKVIVSKQIGKKVNASYSRPLTGDKQSNEVRLQWLFHPDWSLIMNYQNQATEQETSIIQNNQNDNGVGGLDLEYKKEFK